MKGRKAEYSSAAEKQKAYRERQKRNANTVTKLHPARQAYKDALAAVRLLEQYALSDVWFEKHCADHFLHQIARAAWAASSDSLEHQRAAAGMKNCNPLYVEYSYEDDIRTLNGLAI